MIKILLTICSLSTIAAWSQTNVIENGDFELWNDMPFGTFVDDWETSEGQWPGEGTINQSTDASDGVYSMRMETNLTTQGDTVFGYIVFGDGQNFIGNPYSDAVDSLVFWAKYDFPAGDSGTVAVVQHVLGSQIPMIWTIGGTQTTWTRMAYALSSPTQDSLLVAFASSNAFVFNGIPGSYFMVDNVTLKHAVTTPTALPNNSFENWTSVNIEDPDFWGTTNSFLLSSGGSANVIKSTDANGGMYAAELTTVVAPAVLGGGTLPGAITNGTIDQNGFGGGVDYSASPTMLDGAYKFAPGHTADTAWLNITFWSGGAGIIEDVFYQFSPAASYTNFSIPLTVGSVPDSMVLILYSGDSTGSVLHVDDLVISGGNVGIDEMNPFGGISLYPNPADEQTMISFDQHVVGELRLTTVDGKLIRRTNVNGNNHIISTQDLAPGMYLVEVMSGNSREVKRLMVR